MRKMRKIIIFLILVVCSSFAIAATCGTGSTSGMISYWKLDQASGPVIDSYGSNDGTNNGAARNVTGQVNKSFDFSGAEGEEVDVWDIDNNFTSGFTFTAWFKADQTSSARRIIEGSGANTEGLSIYTYQNTLKFRLGIGGSFVEKAYAFTDTSNWHHLAAVWNGSSFLQYIDGAYMGEVAAATYSDSTNHVIGGRVGATQNWDGKIDEIATFNRALTSSEISQLYSAGNSNEPICTLEEGVIPEVSNNALQIFVILIVALLIGALFWRKR